MKTEHAIRGEVGRMTGQDLKEYIAEVKNSDIPKPSKKNIINILYERMHKDGWIPCSKKMPEVPDGTEDDCCPEFNVTIEGAQEATTLRYGPDDTWFDDFGNIYTVTAWQPLPQPYNLHQGNIIPAEKQKAKKPHVNKHYYFCPRCGARRSIKQRNDFCHDCGQQLDWSTEIKPAER